MTQQLPQPRPSDRFIPWYIVMFFIFQAALFSWFTYIAEKTHTGVVTERAYEKGLAYNRTIEKARMQDALGFMSVTEYEDGRVRFILKDRNGMPVTEARVSAVFFRPVHDGIDVETELPWAQGVYSAAIALPERGLWEVRIHAATAAGSYQATQRINVK